MQGDLISREYMREAITTLVAQKGGKVTTQDILYEISNAPTAFDIEEKIQKLNAGARKMCFVDAGRDTKYYKAVGTHFMERVLRETTEKEPEVDILEERE